MTTPADAKTEPLFPPEVVERCAFAAGLAWNLGRQEVAIAVLRESGHDKMVAALVEARKLGMKIYHNANAHEAPKDWATVKQLIDAALQAAGASPRD